MRAETDEGIGEARALFRIVLVLNDVGLRVNGNTIDGEKEIAPLDAGAGRGRLRRHLIGRDTFGREPQRTPSSTSCHLAEVMMFAVPSAPRRRATASAKAVRPQTRQRASARSARPAPVGRVSPVFVIGPERHSVSI